MPDFSLGRWRIQVRERGLVVREQSGPDPSVAYECFERIATEHVANSVTNIELQFRPANARRFKAVEQIVGSQRIVWAPDYIREILGAKL